MLTGYKRVGLRSQTTERRKVMTETSDIKSAGMRIYTWAWDGHCAAKPGEKLTVGVDILEAQVHNLAGDTLAVLEMLPYEMYAEKGLTTRR